MAVNITNVSNIGGMYDMGYYASEATGGLFFGIILVCIWVVVTFNLRGLGIDRAVAASSFASLVASVFLLYLNFVNILYPVVFSLMLAGTLFYIRFKEKG